MSKSQQLTVETGGQRCDAFLAAQLPDHSRAFWQKRCETGDVLVNGQVAKASTRLEVGDQLTVHLPEQPDFKAQTIPILYEDPDVLVLNKPAGLLTHAKGAALEEFSVAEFARPRTTDASESNRPGIVHRLDRGTSGVIIVAKHPAAKQWLQRQFSQRKVKKIYIALVEGHLKEPAARVDLPIERDPKQPQRFRVSANGRAAETIYTTTQVFAHYSLLRLEPQTGRTHQLRVHLSYLGHPIVGDALYGTAEPRLNRLFLHAAELELTPPSRERKTFTAPLPPELHNFLKTIQ